MKPRSGDRRTTTRKRDGVEEQREREAIRAVLDGDPEPFAEIVQEYQKLVASVAWKMNVQPDRVDDVVSEVFLKVYRKLASYDDSYAFSTWLYRLTTNHVLDRYRKRKRRGETDLEDLPEPRDHGSGADAGLLESERDRLVREVLNDMPEIYREVLALHHLEGLAVAEVSETLGVPEGTVKVRLMRGRKKLRRALEATAPEHFAAQAGAI